MAAGFLAFSPAVASSDPTTEPPQNASRSADIASERTERSQTWPAKSGGTVTRIYGQPEFSRDSEGGLRRINPVIRETREGLAADVGDGTVVLPTGDGAGTDVVLQKGRHRAALRLHDVRTVVPRVDAATAVYDGVRAGVDRRLRAVSGGVKEDLILESADAARTFDYTLELSRGLLPRAARDGSITVHDRDRRFVFAIPRGVAYEQRHGERTVVRFALGKGPSGEWIVRSRIDDRWLDDPRREWPVVIDPSITTDPLSGSFDQCATWDDASCYPGGSDYVSAGWIDQLGTRQIPLFKGFSLPPSLGSSFTITSAKLRFHVGNITYDGNNAPSTYRLQAAVAGPDVPSERFYQPLSLSTLDEAKVEPNSPASLDVTTQVRKWQASGKPASEGIGIRFAGSPVDVSDGSECLNQQVNWCDGLNVRIASELHQDAAKRPYLEVSSAPPAQSGSEIESPLEGKLTSRFAELRAYAASENVQTASFEYTTGNSKDWTPIPLAALRFKASGAQPSSAVVPVADQRSTRLIWDLNKTPGAELDGDVHVRAMLDTTTAANGGGITKTRNFRVDRKNPDNAETEDIGPANVSLMTGDAAITETDASIDAFLDDLKLTRTYHSRGGGQRTTDMFGPGWISSFEVDGGEMPYRSIYSFVEVDEEQELTDWTLDGIGAFFESYDEDSESFDFGTLEVNPIFTTVRHETTYAVLERADGAKLTFRKSGATWIVDPEHPEVKVVSEGNEFVVRDADGGVTRFSADDTGAPQYRPTSYAEPGSSTRTTFQYATVGGRKRLARVVAPNPSGHACTGSTWTAGCRALEIGWGTVSVDGRQESRVTAVRLRAVDPSGVAAGDTHTLATYEYDSSGRLSKVSDPRTSTGLPTAYAYDAQGRMTTYTPAGERPWTFAYTTVPGDTGTGRVQAITRKTPDGTDATTTLVYNVPLSGAGAPYDLSATAVAGWGQTDRPWTATAVFPPDATPPSSGMPTSYTRATVSYLGLNGHAVNVADPLGNVTTAEYDDRGNVVRELTARNRERALAAGSTSAARSHQLDTQYSFDGNGVDVLSTLGPEHHIRRPDGSTVLGRQRTRHAYDQGKPAAFTADLHLVTATETGTLRSSDNAFIDTEPTTYAYSDGANQRGWEVRQPLAVTRGSGTEASTTKYKFHATLPLQIEKQMPKANGSDSHSTTYAYYGVGTGPAWCSTGAGLSSAAAASGLLCAAIPAAQPTAGPDRTGTYSRYSLLWETTDTREATSSSNVANGPLRTVSIGRDALGRETSRAVSATTGRAIPSTTTTYHASTGRKAVTTSAAVAGSAQNAVSRTWDDNGRLATYTDADAGTTTYAYDINGRVTSIADPRGTRGHVYDARDGVSAVTDSTLAGPITTTRDADGELTEQVLPGGLKASTVINENGDPVELTWARTTGCTGNCTWVQSNVQRDGRGRIARHVTQNAEQRFTYDSLGRIARSDEQRGTACTRRDYVYDKNSNRSAMTSRVATSGAACGTGTATTKDYSYDGADRLKNTGYSYDPLGQSSAVPAADAAGGTAATLTHDVDGLLASTTQGSTSQTLQRDPERRLRSESSNPLGGPAALFTLRYGDDEDVPTAKTSSGGWERYVSDAGDTHVATVTNNGTVTWELADLKGDTVATAAYGATVPATKSEYAEFGSSAWNSGTITAEGIRHAWLGGYGMHTASLPGGLVHMGVRTYLPSIGRFLEPDPVEGGSANAYDYVSQEPVNRTDLSGEACVPCAVWAVRAAPFVVRGARAGFSAMAKSKKGRSGATRGSEHTGGARQSTLGKHQKGQARNQQVNRDKKRNKNGWIPNGNKRQRRD